MPGAARNPAALIGGLRPRPRSNSMRAHRLLRPRPLSRPPVGRRLHLDPLWITCDPGNLAWRRTLELAGAEFIEIVDVPEDSVVHRSGHPRRRRYRLSTLDRMHGASLKRRVLRASESLTRLRLRPTRWIRFSQRSGSQIGFPGELGGLSVRSAWSRLARVVLYCPTSAAVASRAETSLAKPAKLAKKTRLADLDLIRDRT